MMVTLRAKEQAELLRRLGDDDKYWRHMPFVFELRVKNQAFVYPLVLNPSRYSVSTPFTVRETMTLFGGVVVEENGIVIRRISLAGTMGLLPKTVVGGTFPFIHNPAPSFKPRGAGMSTLMSGQRHLQFLEDRIFKTYGDLKKNPETSATTRLHFHSLKDGDSYLVVPVSFDIMRAVPRTTYNSYSIELLALRSVDAVRLTPSPDKNFLNQLQDIHDTVRSVYNEISGAIKDITRFARDVERVVNSVGATLVAISSVGNIVADFLDGVTSAIAAPFNVVANTINAIETSIEQVIDAGVNGGDHIVASFLRAKDALWTLSIHPRAFDPTVNELVRRGRSVYETRTRLIEDHVAASRSALEAAAEDTTPITSEQFAKLSILPGDLDRSRAQTFETGEQGAITGYRAYTILRGDTLQGIALRELGAVSRWREIAYANKLVAPYISEHGLPGTARHGDQILLPTQDIGTTTEQLGVVGIVGVKATDSLQDRLYGRDLAFVSDAQGFYDIPIDVTNGAVDGQTVRGVACVSQALELRVAIERGHFPLYPSLGIFALSGLRSDIETEIIEIRVTETLLEDSRVRAVSAVKVGAPDADVRSIEANAVLVAHDQSVTIESNVTTR